MSILTLNKTYWYAVETRVRSEYAALREISALGFDCYLPQETRLKRTRKGRFVVQHPLMPGFLFVGTTVPPIIDVDSPDHPHPIFQVLNLPSVRNLVRGAGGGIHPLRPRVVDGWRVDFVEHLRSREEAGDFDNRPREKTEATKARTLTGAFKDQLAQVMATFYPDLTQKAA